MCEQAWHPCPHSHPCSWKPGAGLLLRSLSPVFLRLPDPNKPTSPGMLTWHQWLASAPRQPRSPHKSVPASFWGLSPAQLTLSWASSSWASSTSRCTLAATHRYLKKR